jgi:hypothetical protein
VQSNLALAQVRITRFSLVSKPPSFRGELATKLVVVSQEKPRKVSNQPVLALKKDECAMYVQAVEELWRITEGVLTLF